jgi:hypothetical protein
MFELEMQDTQDELKATLALLLFMLAFLYLNMLKCGRLLDQWEAFRTERARVLDDDTSSEEGGNTSQ